MLEVIVQRVTKIHPLPSDDQFILWAQTAVQSHKKEKHSMTLRLVDKPEMQQINSQFRKKNKPTNVLAFPFINNLIHNDQFILGDIIICAPIVIEEAQAQHKSSEAHWAHLVIHGCLHCLGYDHQNTAEAETMESFETKLLKQLGYPNPYLAKK